MDGMTIYISANCPSCNGVVFHAEAIDRYLCHECEKWFEFDQLKHCRSGIEILDA